MPARFPQLDKLSLSGLAFMDILHLGDDWLTTVKATRSPHITLYISDIQFQTTMRRNHESADSSSIFDFLRLISALSPPCGIHFKNLSLSYRPHGKRLRDAEHLHKIFTSLLSFDNVSPDALVEFFQLAEWLSGSTTFSRCSIPRLSGNLSPSYDLTFKHIPPSDTSAQDDSLCNILSIWSGDRRDALSVTSCDAFNDEFLRWLGEKGEDGKINAKGIRAFFIEDCTNFTAGILLDLIDFLSTTDMQEQEGRENSGPLHGFADVKRVSSGV
ncbi:hypothetical protein BDZ97DRAFT_1920479 [Flammula alnicola]|nr:hypothetical protein BDZ97DRAFT_1920479 [Flammula alnicola]